MIELLNDLEEHSKKQLERINDELDSKGHFVCARQIDDMKSLISSIKKIEELKLMPSVK